MHKSRENEGGRCRQFAMRGGSLCQKHGGTRKATRAAAERREGERLAELEARRLGVRFGGQGVEQVSPAQAMLEALWQARADMQLYGWLVGEIENGSLTAETFHLTGTATGEARRVILVEMYEQAQDRVARIASQCLKAKIAEEYVKVAQERAAAFAEGVRAVVLALGHSPTDPQVRQAMRAGMDVAAGTQRTAQPARPPSS